MYRILIVDDEPVIVNGLYEIFMEVEHLDLDVCTAYSGDKALEWLQRAKIDVVLTDIRMPGMSGLELQRAISEQWPECKVIFLTGYDNFEYIQSAMRHSGVDYILKTEDDEVILESVDKAIAAIAEQRRATDALQKAKRQLQLAVPALQRDYLLRLCEGTLSHATRLPEPDKLADLGISLRYDAPILPIAGRIDRSGEMTAADSALLSYALHNIAEELLSPCIVQSVAIDAARFLWLVQPGADAPGGERWGERIVKFVHGTLETVQGKSKELLKLPVSLAAWSEAVPWNRLAEASDHLRRMLGIGLGYEQEMLLLGGATNLGEEVALSGESKAEEQSIRGMLKRFSEAEALMENGQRAELIRLIEEVRDRLEQIGYKPTLFIEAYYSIALPLIRQFSKWTSTNDRTTVTKLEILSDARGHATPREGIAYLRRAADEAFELRISAQDERTSQVVTTLHQYIEANLHGDLSLTALSELVYLNPYYLSRLYKQITGRALTDHISRVRVAKAKQLLTETFLKVHEVAQQVGFDSSAYFARLFKQATGLTPQEYRDSANR